MKVKEVLDSMFEPYEFNEKLLKELIRVNIDFTTSNKEIRDMLGSKLLGCHHVSYTQYHKNIFYEDLFPGLSYDEVELEIRRIKSIPTHFKIARDDINLVCFYVAHRFLTSKSLNEKQKIEAAEEIFNYFGYRTLVLLSANYWIYPTTVDKATSVSEVLSKKYLIARLKNWNEYVHYRSEAYVKSKFKKLLIDFNNDKELPNAINDLYNRYKDTVKNIYSEFINLEDSKFIRSTSSVTTDLEGRQVLLDNMTNPVKYVDKVRTSLSSKDDFIKPSYLSVVSEMFQSISYDQIEECLKSIYDYHNSSPKYNKESTKFVEDFITDSISYLQKNRMYLTNNKDVISIINTIVGNLLYSRGMDASITEVKARGEELIKSAYKKSKITVSDRSLSSLRNAYCVYILILALI